jgi:NAD+ kinase
VLFPSDTVLQIKVPEDARSNAMLSFDGRHRMELMRGDTVVVYASRYPVPTFCSADPTADWFASVSGCLKWNERVRQGASDG